MEGSCAQALYDFPQDAEDDLAMTVGDIIKVTKRVNDEWLWGVSKNGRGQFPAAFVEVVFEEIPESVGVAIADFLGEEDGDLSFNTGDVVGIVEVIDENWCSGRTSTSSGIYPRSFVETVDFVSDSDENNHQKENGVVVSAEEAEQAYGMSNEAFTAQSSEELTFPKGVRIDLLKEIDSFWTLGSYKGVKGKFPSMFVDVMCELPEQLKFIEEKTSEIAKSDDGTVPKAKALFMYIGAGDQDLNFDKGDIILLKEKVNEEWLVGQIGNSVGMFPASYVQVIVDLPFDTPVWKQEAPITTTKTKEGGSTNEISNGHVPKNEMAPARKRQAPTVVKVKTSKEEKGTGSVSKAPTPVPKPILAPKPPVVASKPAAPNPNFFPLNNDCITVVKPGRKLSKKEKSLKSKAAPTPKPAARSSLKQSVMKEQSSHAASSPPTVRKGEPSLKPAPPVSSGINAPGVHNVNKRQVIVTKKTEPVKQTAQDQRRSNARAPGAKRPAPPLPVQSKDQPRVPPTRRNVDLNDLLSGDAAPVLRLPKPLAPQPPARPNANTAMIAPQAVTSPGNVSRSEESSHKEVAGKLKAPIPEVHFSTLSNPPIERKALTPPPERRARPKSAYFQPGDRSQTMRKSTSLSRRNTTRPNNKSSSKFFVDMARPDINAEGVGDLTSVEMKISEIQTKISGEANLLSGVETLLEVVTDPYKLTELKSKQAQHLSVIKELNEELTDLEDEKSYLLAKYGKAEDIRNHMVRVEQQIQMLKSETDQFEKSAEITTFEDLAQAREDSDFCRYMISALQEELVTLRERLVECQKQDANPEELAAKQLEQRAKVIEELIRTERDYVRDITLCTSQVIPVLSNSKAASINCKILFGNLSDVARVSTSLLQKLETAIQSTIENIGTTLGQCFIDLSAELKGCYAIYCKNYDDAQALSEKYEQDPVAREEVMNAMKLIRGENLTWDLPSYLIKPVQRILKYPLLLQEFLKSTPENEQGRSVIALAINSMTDVATSINEFKRRKDLVQKYQKAEGFGDKISRLNWHSVLKKSSRINQRLTQITGINARTVDTAYDEEEKKVRGLEKLIKTLIKNLGVYIEGIQEQTALHKQNISNIYEFCEDLAPPDQVKLFILASQNVVAAFEKHISYIQGHVFDPMNTLLQVFQSPFRLMEKREDKLLDYDSLQQKSFRTKDKDKVKQVQDDLVKAKNNYHALNSQLLEELPKLIAKCSKYVMFCLTNLIRGHRRHSMEIKNQLGSLPQTAIPADSAAILSMHSEAIQLASEQLAKLTFTPEKSNAATDNRKSMNVESAMNMTGTLGRTNFYVDFSVLENESSDDPTSPITPNPDVSRELLDFENSPIRQTRMNQEQPVPLSPLIDKWNGVPREDIFRAKFSFDAEEKAEITVSEGDQLRVLSKSDKSGNSEWWLVESQESKGYIPNSYLEPFYKEPPQVCINQEDNGRNKATSSSLLDTSVHHDVPTQLPFFGTQATSTPVKPQQVFAAPSPLPVDQKNTHNTVSHDLNRSESTEDNSQVAEFYVAEFDFEKSNVGELDLVEGALVRVVSKHDYHGNTEWWLVEVDGVKGYVPGNYLSFVHSVQLG